MSRRLKKEQVEDQIDDADIVDQVEDTVVEEETEAAATLSPNSRPADATMSKAGMMASMMGAMNSMKRSDLVDFFNQSMAQFGPNHFPGADSVNTSAKNMDSIKAKPSAASMAKEDIDGMFAGEELTEEFKQQVETVFEAAVNARVVLEEARIKEEFEASFSELVEEYKEELTEKVDEYLSYAVEQWVEENRLALETGLKVEIFENFFQGLKNLFVENNVSIPDEEVSLVGELEAKVEALESRVNEEIEKNIELHRENENLNKAIIFETVADGLADSQVEKFKVLAEGLSYTDLEEFTAKLDVVKKTYFSEKKTEAVHSEEVVGVDMLSEEHNTAPATGQMAAYVQAVSRTIKK